MGCVHAFRRQFGCKSCGIVVVIFSVGNSVGASSCKLLKPPFGVFAVSPHVKRTRRCPLLRPPRSCKAGASMARVVHLDHGYVIRVKMMPIQRMTYCRRLRVEVYEYCVSLLTVISPAADKHCVLEYHYFPPHLTKEELCDWSVCRKIMLAGGEYRRMPNFEASLRHKHTGETVPRLAIVERTVECNTAGSNAL